MSVDLVHFAPLPALAGGLMIGAAVTLLVLGNGRIAGVSGVLGNLLQPRRGDIAWRVAFIAGLVAAPWFWRLAVHGGFAPPLPVSIVSASPFVVVAAGLLVGIGTRYASGCTSGHGVCGVARGSPRSLVATACFMATGFATVFFVRHLLGA